MKYNIGDVGRVKSTGHVYSSYSKMFEKMGFKNITVNHAISKDTVVSVFSIGEHPEQRITLLGIRDGDGKECLIGVKGVEIFESFINYEIY